MQTLLKLFDSPALAAASPGVLKKGGGHPAADLTKTGETNAEFLQIMKTVLGAKAERLDPSLAKLDWGAFFGAQNISLEDLLHATDPGFVAPEQFPGEEPGLAELLAAVGEQGIDRATLFAAMQGLIKEQVAVAPGTEVSLDPAEGVAMEAGALGIVSLSPGAVLDAGAGDATASVHATATPGQVAVDGDQAGKIPVPGEQLPAGIASAAEMPEAEVSGQNPRQAHEGAASFGGTALDKQVAAGNNAANRIDFATTNGKQNRSSVDAALFAQPDRKKDETGQLRGLVAESASRSDSSATADASFTSNSAQSRFDASLTPQVHTMRFENAQQTERGAALFAGAEVDQASSMPLAQSDEPASDDIIRQIVQRMTLRSNQNHASMHIQLKPEYLGDLRMQIITENQMVTVRMTAESNAAKEILEQNLHQLRHELQQHGLQVDKFDVFVQQDDDAWKQGQGHSAYRHQGQQRRFHQTGGGSQMAEGNNEALGRTASGGQAGLPGSRLVSDIDCFA